MRKSLINRRFLHAIVGFNISPYILNALESIIIKDQSCNIILCVTGSEKKINNTISDDIKRLIKKHRFQGFIKIKKFKHKLNALSKTGSYYTALNFILDFCYKNNISTLHVMQNDFQLMEWKSVFLDIIEEIFENDKNLVCICPAFPREGNHPNFFKSNVIFKNIFFKSIKKRLGVMYQKKTPSGDWGLFDIKKLKKIRYKFREDEQTSINIFLKKGLSYRVFFPFPFIACIPWPAIVRDGKIWNSPLKLKNLILSNRYENNYLKLNKLKSFQENFFLPNQWWCLYPCLYSDIQIKQYLKTLSMHKKNYKVSIPYFRNLNLKRSFLNFFSPYKTRVNVYQLFFWYIYNFLYYKLRKIFHIK